ncbi:hypothetical protein Daus18300_011205 [Diaporthe australafricana]|uniref:Peptidase S8/S53 domain-containing protein n=1 Tax=Diaporthe australafricana TaxID=127596 RepID=A0ABR3W7J3_9PEZI
MTEPNSIERRPTLTRLQSARESSLSAKEALRSLAENNDAHPERSKWLKKLGNGSSYNARNLRKKRDEVTSQHEDLAWDFYNRGAKITQKQILNHLAKDDSGGKPPVYRLDDLLAFGDSGQSILHIVLEFNTYQTKHDDSDNRGEKFTFDVSKVKPFITFLLQLHPKLPIMTEKISNSVPPLFGILSTEIDPDRESTGTPAPVLGVTQKEEIVQFLCDTPDPKNNPDGVHSAEAIKSLAIRVFSKSQESDKGRLAVHVAIENHIRFSEELVKALCSISSQNGNQNTSSCLTSRDRDGKTCLHSALTRPFSLAKIQWAKRLACLVPSVLQVEALCPSSEIPAGGPKPKLKTPLQHFADQLKAKELEGSRKRASADTSSTELRKELEELENDLNRQCLVNFDAEVCKGIMYSGGNTRQVFLTLEDDRVSWELLDQQNNHYTLGKTLRSVYISPSVIIEWDNASANIHKEAKDWECAGNIEFYLIFGWLSKRQVSKVIEVVVYDFETNERKSHSDQAIAKCLQGFKVEIWDWKRMDIPTHIIFEACKDHVRTLYLYCSGLKAVLESWASVTGLVRLEKLETVTVEVHQGLESAKTIDRYIADFKKDLKSMFRKRPIDIHCKRMPGSGRHGAGGGLVAPKRKGESEHGYREQEWLKCMDDFADFMQYFTKVPSENRTKVAIIDDGVKTSYEQLNNNVGCGWQQPAVIKFDKSGKELPRQREFLRDYNSSYTGHGTAIAWYIRRVCPDVELHIAKLQPDGVRTGDTGNLQVTFSTESASKAIKWAVEQRVHIICMSWAIDEMDENARKRLREAVTEAADEGILLFCANPDRGTSTSENKTYPYYENSTRVFCIGAADQDGKRWSKIPSNDNSCNYLFPGVELGIPVIDTAKTKMGKPAEDWRKHSGSSLACALATGLAAMILHCARVSKSESADDTWKWLKTRNGMDSAFKAINDDENTEGKWLVVQRIFGKVAEQRSGDEESMAMALEDRVMLELVRKRPRKV